MRPFFLPLLLLCGCGSSPTTATLPGVTSTLAGDTQSRTITLRHNGSTLVTLATDAFAIATVTRLDPRASYDPFAYWPDDPTLAVSPPSDLAWHVPLDWSLRSSTTQSITIGLSYDSHATARVELASASPDGTRWDARFIPEQPFDNAQIAMLRLSAQVDTKEAFYGLGEWGDSVEQRGHVRPVQIEEASLENGSDENHAPVPLLVGVSGWALFIETQRVGTFDVAHSARDTVIATFGTAESSSQGLSFHLFAADTALDVFRPYYELTGQPLLPAQWALGPWLWRNETRDQTQFTSDLNMIRDLDLATSGIWLDRPYASAVETFDYDPAKFTDAPSMIQLAHDLGFRVGLWHAPYLEDAAKPYVDEATTNGYFIPRTGLLLNPWSAPIDFTNSAAYSFWQSLIHRYTDMGIEGFKLDYGEDIAPNLLGARNPWAFADGSDERTMHYGYTRLYHRVYSETLPQSGHWLDCRAARWGDQTQVTVMWPGDLDATFAHKGDIASDNGKTYHSVGGLPASIADGLSLAASGFPFFASDTGGFLHSPPNRELFVRWTEQTALSTVMHVGDASSQMPWEFTSDNGRDSAALDVYRTYARLHVRLFPYVWTYAQRLLTDGRPIARALGLAHPELGTHPSDTYFIGDDLLVAPVIEAGAVERKVTLPAGDWIDWWDGTLYKGGNEVTVPAPIDKLPLLLRAGAIVPLLRPTIDSMAPTTQPTRVDSFATDSGALWVRIAPSQPGTFTLYDGAKIDSDPSGKIDYSGGSVFVSGAVLELIGVAAPTSITLDGTPLVALQSKDALSVAPSGWYWESAAGGTLWLRVSDGKHAISYK